MGVVLAGRRAGGVVECRHCSSGASAFAREVVPARSQTRPSTTPPALLIHSDPAEETNTATAISRVSPHRNDHGAWPTETLDDGVG
jgi:hypothetical protein